MKTELIDPVKDPRWLKFIESNNDASIFHHPAWLQVISRQYKYNIQCICTVENSIITSGIIFCPVRGITGRKKIVSLPFADHVEPLWKEEANLIALASRLKEEVSQNRTGAIEIRSALPESAGFLASSDAVLHSARLDAPPEELFQKLNKSRVQRGINKALKENLESRISASGDDMEKFYSLHLKTRKRLGVPIQPKNFFRIFLDEIIKKDFGFISVVEKNGIALAAGIFAGFGKTLIYKYGASDPAMLQPKPNHLMFWNAICEASGRGFQNFDFGKTDIPDTGLREFKSGWAAVETPLYYSYFPELPEGKLTGFLIKKVIRPFIKFSPGFVCRLTGELFYKFAP